MNIRSIADLQDILIVADEDDTEDYYDDEFEDDSTPVKSHANPFPVTAELLPSIHEDYELSAGRPWEDQEEEEYSVRSYESKDESKEEQVPPGQMPDYQTPSERNSSDTDSKKSKPDNNLTEEKNIAKNKTAPQRDATSAVYRPSFMKSPSSSEKTAGKRQAKSAFMSRVSWGAAPISKERPDIRPTAATTGRPTDLLNKIDLEEAVRRVVQNMEAEKRSNATYNLTKRAIPIPSIRSQREIDADKGVHTLNERETPAAFASTYDVEEVIPFYDPDYPKAVTMEEVVMDKLQQPIKGFQRYENPTPGSNYTYKKPLNVPEYSSYIACNAENRPPTRGNFPCAYQQNEKHIPLDDVKQKNNNNRTLGTRNSVKNDVETIRESGDTLSEYSQLSAMKCDQPASKRGSSLKLRGWTDEKVIDLRIKAESIYADFIRDVIGNCKRRAEESESAEEMAMHRVLAEHMLNIHGNKKEVEKIRDEMTRAAARNARVTL